jgi:excisionase family DNA binding protein
MQRSTEIGADFEKEELHGLDKVAQRLDVSIWTIRKWCVERRIASIRLGTRRLIRESEIQRVMKEGLRKFGE